MIPSLEHLVLSARSWWCEPGEPILWSFLDPFRVPLFEVRGLTEHGKKQRNLLTRAAFQVGAMPARLSAWSSFNAEENADQRAVPSAIVTARVVDSLAVRLTGTDGTGITGRDPGIVVATPGRLAVLEVAENPAGAGAFDAVRTYAGAVYSLAEDFAGTLGSTHNTRGRYFDHQGRTRIPEVVERGCVATDRISGFDVVDRTFRGLGYDAENRRGKYLRIGFDDGSALELDVPGGADPDRVLRLVRGEEARW